jgi:hypothetical protein
MVALMYLRKKPWERRQFTKAKGCRLLLGSPYNGQEES